MAFLKKAILLCLAGVIISVIAFLAWEESFYLDIKPFVPPVVYSGCIPIRNDSMGSGDFGKRRNGHRRHRGLDIISEIGSPVRASKGGLAFACDEKAGMGKFIMIKHKNGLGTLYGHLSKVYIRPIQLVRQGQLIGEVGRSGNANDRRIQTHLHFEVRKYGIPLDPKDYLCKQITSKN